MARLVEFADALHLVLAFMFQQYRRMHRNKTAQKGEQKLWTKTYIRQHTRTKPNKGKRGEELSMRRGLLSSCFHLKQKKKKVQGGQCYFTHI
jgi:hypothetical protein